MIHVELKNLAKNYGRVQVIEGLNLSIEEGEFTVFVGPSGCGKSTLLRMIAGLEDISGGDILISGRRVNDETPTERGISMVFQNYALYPHMTVEQNIAFGLKMAGQSKKVIAPKVAKAAQTLQLESYLKRKPAELSGGQRQRVAIGRAIVREPELFLFDEPLSNLDAELRVSMRMEIARLHQKLKNTMIYVTHDQTEAMTLADQIVVLRDGKVEQVGTPEELYEKPCNTFVAGFIGSPPMNMIPQSVASKIGIENNSNGIPDIGSIGIRPEDIIVNGEGSQLMVDVEAIEYLGGMGFVYGRLQSDTTLTIEWRGKAKVKIGDRIPIHFPIESLHVFSNMGARLET